MARKNGPTPDDLEFSSQSGSARSEVDDYPGRAFDGGEALDAARLMDIDPDEESPFRRAQKRVPVRRSPIPKKTAKWLKSALVGLAITCAAGASLWAVRYYTLKAPRFASPPSSDDIQVSGNKYSTREDILAVFGEDISRNVFRVPLEERKRKLEELPWVESATVMRYLPNRIAVVVKERTPVAQVLLGSRPALIDAAGVVMEMPEGVPFPFPVLTGFSEDDPISTRRARVSIYQALVRDLDSEGKGYSKDLSEVDVTNPEDIRITLTSNDVVHMEKKKFPQEDKFMQQYSKYLEVLPQCRSRFGTANIDVDTRYENQTPCRLADGQSAQTAEAAATSPEVMQVQPQRPAVKPAATPVVQRKKSRWRAKKH